MLTINYLEKLVGRNIYASGYDLFQSGAVFDLQATCSEDGYTNLSAYVSGPIMDYPVEVMLGANDNFLLYSRCGCRYYQKTNRVCEHIVAVLLQYLDGEQRSMIGSGYHKPKRETNADLKSLISKYESDSIPTKSSGTPVVLEPHVVGITEDHGLEVSFKIYRGTSHKYIIQNLDDFCFRVRDNEFKSYGKALEFVHSIHAFRSNCRPIVEFLMDLSAKRDQYLPKSSYTFYGNYAFNEQSMKKTLVLRGSYLDSFLKLLPYQCVYTSMDTSYPNMESLFSILPGTPNVTTTLKEVDQGYTFEGNMDNFAIGQDSLYFMDYEHQQLIVAPKEDANILSLYEFIYQHLTPVFIRKSDLPSFSRFVYPLLQAHTKVSKDSFVPDVYIPPKPTFEIYLDSPDQDTITCECYAMYPDTKYSIFDDTTDTSIRDLSTERSVDEQISPWFNSYNHEHKQMILIDDDDMTYQFLQEGIPSLQAIGTVYVSDRLKKLQIKQSPKFHIGISVSHNLLQLDLVTETMNPKQLADILARYNAKKKYYRLKDGSFINLDDSLNQLAELKESLGITNAQLASGEIEVPRYRASYIDQFVNDNDSTYFTRDFSFDEMIRNIDAVKQKTYEVPSDLKADLRHYQVDGFQWLCALRDNGFSGLLADEMGLGKTIQVISFLGAWKDHKRILIVCPASLVYNWSSEIQKFLPSLKSRMISGSVQMRKELITSSSEDEVLITSYDLLKRDVEVYQDMEFSCEVIDEAQYIKNAVTQASKAVKSINAQFKIALTGTPIENRLSELWSIFDYLLPGYFYSYKHFRDQFETPIVHDQDEDVENRLKNMIAPFVLRRLKKDVLLDLPEKLEEVLYAPLEGEQKELYEARVQRLKLMLNKQSDQEFKENKMIVLAELTRLRQICCDPSLVYQGYTNNSSKTDLCIDMIENAVEAGHKVLLFSQFTSMLERLTKRLQAHGIAYHLLEGSTNKKKRADMVESFQQDDVPVFCISLKAGGTGLNLTAADIVIHYDPWWNTAVENQASDRAHRIGQKNVVSVCRLILKDTLEERILNLQQEKSNLADRILSGEGVSSASLTREDLLSIL